MLRSAPAGFLTRSALRLGSSQVRATAPTARRFHHFSQRDVPRSKSPFQLALVPYRPISTSLQRPNTASTLPSGAEKTYEKQPGEDKSVPHSGESSSVQEVSHEKVDGNEKIKVVEEEEDIDMFAEVKSDWVNPSF